MHLKTFFLTAALVSALMARAIIAAETQTVASFNKTISKTVGYQYLLSLPSGYDASSEKRWPVILFLHGAGERGSDPWLVAKHGPPKLLRQTDTVQASAAPAESAEATQRRETATKMLKEEFIVVSPQCPIGTWWDDDGVLALLDEIIGKHKVDTQRVYLTGLSMGGYGAWSVGIKNATRFAAIAAVCGGGQRGDFLRASLTQKEALKTLGIWAFHGAKDTAVPLEESERMVAAAKKAGVSDVRLTVYPEAAHDSWTQTYANPELYVWLLRHTRATPLPK